MSWPTLLPGPHDSDPRLGPQGCARIDPARNSQNPEDRASHLQMPRSGGAWEEVKKDRATAQGVLGVQLVHRWLLRQQVQAPQLRWAQGWQSHLHSTHCCTLLHPPVPSSSNMLIHALSHPEHLIGLVGWSGGSQPSSQLLILRGLPCSRAHLWWSGCAQVPGG